MMSLQPNCSDNNFYTGIRCFFPKHQQVFRFVFFFFFLETSWLALLVGSVGPEKMEKGDGVITVWPKKNVSFLEVKSQPPLSGK